MEFLFRFPLFALLFTRHPATGMNRIHVPRLKRCIGKCRFVAHTIFVSVVIAALFFVDIPALGYLMERIPIIEK